MIIRGKLRLLGDKKDQSQIEIPLTIKEATRVEPYGIHSSPPLDKDAYAFFINGDNADGVHFLTGDDQEMPELETGEIAIYRDKDNYVKLGNSTTEVKRNGMSLTITDDGRLSIKNGDKDFMEIFSKIVEIIRDHQTPTMMGPQTSPSLLLLNTELAKLREVLK